MPNYTPNLNLEKPLQTETYNIAVHNANSDKIDAASNEHRTAAVLDHPNGSVTEPKLAPEAVSTRALSKTGVAAGTYKSVTVDVKGRVTGGTNPTTLAGYGITDAYDKTESDNRFVNATGDTLTGVLLGANDSNYRAKGTSADRTSVTQGVGDQSVFPALAIDKNGKELGAVASFRYPKDKQTFTNLRAYTKDGLYAEIRIRAGDNHTFFGEYNYSGYSGNFTFDVPLTDNSVIIPTTSWIQSRLLNGDNIYADTIKFSNGNEIVFDGFSDDSEKACYVGYRSKSGKGKIKEYFFHNMKGSPANIRAAIFYGYLAGRAQRSESLCNMFNPTANGSANRPASANVSSDNTGGVRKFLASSAMSIGKPEGDGHILNLDWDNSDVWNTQLFVPQIQTTHVQVRSLAGGIWQPWKSLAYLDELPGLSTTSADGLLPRLSGNANDVMTGTGAWWNRTWRQAYSGAFTTVGGVVCTLPANWVEVYLTASTFGSSGLENSGIYSKSDQGKELEYGRGQCELQFKINSNNQVVLNSIGAGGDGVVRGVYYR